MPRASEMSGEGETPLSPMEATAGRENRRTATAYDDRRVTDGSNLDHFMCEICAAKVECAKALPVSARTDFRLSLAKPPR
jgi:hypothetical protein